MENKIKKNKISNDSFWAIHSLKKAFFFRGSELIVLCIFTSVFYFKYEFSEKELLFVLAVGILVVISVSFIVYKGYESGAERFWQNFNARIQFHKKILTYFKEEWLIYLTSELKNFIYRQKNRIYNLKKY